ncbi:MAG TPA: hypothetical protein EYH45_01325 [Candidatus Caldiarchaeum subterraneum]|uniref:FeS cluster biogenesis domain-containing protein n=1 Tax=Caldiarchaeum subterraneum TaxID=311458 RepID=A0A832ZUG3_CALS0|nr:hypothetical protein [Candidatus Caldarchaeum subterraneum]
MIRLKPESEQLFDRIINELKQRYGSIYIILGDTGCCGYSNVFVTNLEPDSSYEYIGDDRGVGVYVHRGFKDSIDPEEIWIKIMEVDVDDSFSLETELGYRFTLLYKPRFSISDA